MQANVSSSPLRRRTVVLVAGFVFLSLSVRAPFGQIGALQPRVQFPSAVVSVAGLLPPLMMGLLAPVAPVLRRRMGDERALIVACGVGVLGAGIRMLGLPGLLAGTAVMGAAIGVANVLIPVLVRRRFSTSTGLAMGGYALAMGAGSAAVTAATLPVLDATGSWPLAIAVAVVPALLALAGMVPQWWHDEPRAEAVADTVAGHPMRSRLGWSLLLFFGIQSLLFYTTLAWLPSMLVAGGLSPAAAGTLLDALIVCVALGGAAGAAAAGRMRQHHTLIVVTALACATGLLGVLVLPSDARVGAVVVLGIGLGAGQAVPGVLYGKRGTDAAHTASLSAFAQTGGFVLAASGPLLASALHTRAGSWMPVIVCLIGISMLGAPLAWRAGSIGAQRARNSGSASEGESSNSGHRLVGSQPE